MNVIKQSLRKEILARRNSIAHQQLVKASEQIKQQLFQCDFFKKAKTVMAYMDFRNEVMTKDIIQKGIVDGKQMCIPVCNKEIVTITPSLLKDFDADLQTGTWGILEPKPEKMRPIEPKNIDLVIVPGVAFDPKGNRLGYGAGYYDRFLSKTNWQTIFVALAFQLQIVADAFPDTHDVPVHFIITEKELIDCGTYQQKRG